ncbi:MAG: gamma-glutamylcyclotransferase [Oculatellaceae cyanobacterium Prado106]|jgi:gamma-glutamylcyclotransferase (GGCT)/AIG2-like uncharacterized protein YtfP|nr:gamma-glutamylcyclotransferase [Oculatellaceae cyanobacterium Prado106]
MSGSLKLFVYGTLKPGEANYDRYCATQVVEVCEAIARGQLFALPMGYPAMTPGENWVLGYRLTFPDWSLLDDLDELEDYSPYREATENEYYRTKIETFSPDSQSLGKAWAYLMDLEKAKRFGGVLLPKGQWTAKDTA